MPKKSIYGFSSLSYFKLRRVLYVAIFWTVIDFVVKVMEEDVITGLIVRSILVSELLVFVISLFLAYMFMYGFGKKLKQKSIIINLIIKTLVVLFLAFLMSFLIYFLSDLIANGKTASEAFHNFFTESLSIMWLARRTLYWVTLLTFTQLYLEINDKYSPGVFLEILRGKYDEPKIEKRIIMFMDLKDSTPIAESLGHSKYFKFIRDFIREVSMAIIERQGQIYQYVGDEVVTSWTYSPKNMQKALDSIILARKYLQSQSNHFKRRYDFIPEFRVGLHMGEVTIGEIGVIKKDLAMSGDTMNTTARLRSACNEMNVKFIISEEFYTNSNLKEFQTKFLGEVDLKGKADKLKLYALQI